MFNQEFSESHDDLLNRIDAHYRIDETTCVERILSEAELDPALKERIEQKAIQLVKADRERALSRSGLDAFLFQYDLSSEEGIALMCLAEALLRIPDKETVDKLIRDTFSKADWQSHMGKSHSLFVNAATFALMLTGKIVQTPQRKQQESSLTLALQRLISKGGEPIVRQGIHQAMKILGRQFVMARTIKGALKRAQRKEEKGYRYSYDMLGESAYTQADADKYFNAYLKAIQEIEISGLAQGPIQGAGISVKLSALHPRYQMAKRQRLHEELYPRLMELIKAAKKANIGFTIDAEEAHTLMISLELIQRIIDSGELEGWQGFGLAVQAYQKRAPFVLDWLIVQARKAQQPLMVRLVKGAYWDTEIKLSQVQGLDGYPVFTRKMATDVNYLVCVKKLLQANDLIYAQFATHNALTVATVMELAKDFRVTQYEFQCLHGMGGTLYDQIVKDDGKICRIYAPVGTHEDLLAYLVRRLLENGANTSFVNRLVNEELPVEDVVADPVNKLQAIEPKPHPNIPLPQDLFAPFRHNSKGLEISRLSEVVPILRALDQDENSPLLTGNTKSQQTSSVIELYSPANHHHYLGQVHLASALEIEPIIARADEAFKNWQRVNAWERASCLEKMADLLQQHKTQLYSLLVYEGGKTLDDAVSEVREAIDYCYYYALEAKQKFAYPEILTGPTGEHNQLSLHPRGVIACISPWNFPLAIFLGQITGALAAGNCVIAKPASQTTLVAAKTVALLHEAGFPKAVVQLLTTSGKLTQEFVLSDPRIKGVVFTGSTQTANSINQQLAARIGEIIPLIAETGGQNAMIVDSSALPEQVVQDVITSSFRSAGQRCSALRVLFLQEDTADKIINMLKGAMAELSVNHPAKLATDVGPIIDDKPKQQLATHIERMRSKAKLVFEVPLAQDLPPGSYLAPIAFEIPSLDWLTEEVFGPVLHIIRYEAHQLDAIIEQINHTGYGLTLGIHSRIDETIQTITTKAHVGNTYVNRNMIGAVVGVQPFGGEGLSGTGPKAGGPNYITRLAVERTLTINTTAQGGNATLISLAE